MFARMEWLIIELLVVGVLAWEVVHTRRALRRDKAAKDAAKD